MKIPEYAACDYVLGAHVTVPVVIRLTESVKQAMQKGNKMDAVRGKKRLNVFM